MASRDFLIRQIEELGIFLTLLLRRILKIKEENQQGQIESVVKESLLQELKLDIDQVIVLENLEFLALVKEKFTNENQLERLAEILMTLGGDIEHSFTLTKAAYLLKSLFLFAHLQETSRDFSFERRAKILEIQELIGRVGLNE